MFNARSHVTYVVVKVNKSSWYTPRVRHYLHVTKLLTSNRPKVGSLPNMHSGSVAPQRSKTEELGYLTNRTLVYLGVPYIALKILSQLRCQVS